MKPLSTTVALTLVLGGSLLTGAATAQAPSAQLPPGHPPIDSPAAAPIPSDQPALPAGHPPINGPVMPASPLPDDKESQALPPGHPPIDGSPAQPAAPNRSLPAAGDDASLPAGSVIFRVRDGRQQPVVGLDVVLHMTRKSIAEGETLSIRKARADAEGNALFRDLHIGSEWIYQGSATFSSIDYRSPEFQLSPTAGKRVALPVFETTSDIDAARVGVQAYLALEPREEFVQVEQILHFANLGDRTWTVPELLVPVERGYQAFQASEDGADLRLEPIENRGFRVTGFVRPGALEVSFRYQVPYANADSLRFTAFMPPRVAQVRVLSSATGAARMRVEGMPEPVVTRGSDGQRLYVTERAVLPGGDQIDQVVINLQGLPMPGNARWVAAALAAAAVAFGLVSAFGAKKPVAPHQDPVWRADLERTRSLLLERLAALEEARSRGDIGPKTYERSRRELVDSLARLLTSEKRLASSSHA